jgi:4-amino-4-deoxy-L-arabinose transferase-like glycosyltransferase
MATLDMALFRRETARHGKTESYRTLYILLFTIGFVLRFAMVLWRKSYIFPPFWIFENVSIATHLASGQGYSSPFNLDTGPTSWIAPGYPFFLAAVFRMFGIMSRLSMGIIYAVQCAMAGATGIAIHGLAKRTVGAQMGWWAAWIWTLSPFFFRWPTTWIWDFTASALLLALLLILTLDVAEKGGTRLWGKLGAFSGGAVLVNPALLPMLPLFVGYAGYVNRRMGMKWWRGMLLAGVLFGAIIAPWLVRNYVVFGHPVFLRGNYWFEFHLGNYHYSNGMGFSGKHPTKNPIEMRRYIKLGEQGYIQWAKDDALRFVKEYPAEFWSLTIHRVWWFWDGTPLIYESGGWWKPWEYWPLSCTAWLGFLFILTRRPRGWILFAGPLLIYPLPYDFSYCSSKYRHAIEPEMVLLSVYLAYVVWGEIETLRQRRSTKKSESIVSREAEVLA